MKEMMQYEEFCICALFLSQGWRPVERASPSGQMQKVSAGLGSRITTNEVGDAQPILQRSFPSHHCGSQVNATFFRLLMELAVLFWETPGRELFNEARLVMKLLFDASKGHRSVINCFILFKNRSMFSGRGRWYRHCASFSVLAPMGSCGCAVS